MTDSLAAVSYKFISHVRSFGLKLMKAYFATSTSLARFTSSFRLSLSNSVSMTMLNAKYLSVLKTESVSSQLYKSLGMQIGTHFKASCDLLLLRISSFLFNFLCVQMSVLIIANQNVNRQIWRGEYLVFYVLF